MRQTFFALIVIAIIGAVGYYGFYKNGFEMGGAMSLDKQAAKIEKVVSTPLESTAASEADLRRMAELLSDKVTMTIGGYAEGKATDVKITLVKLPETGLSMAELTMYGTDLEAVEAAMSGNEWSELRIADRIEASGIEVFGVDTVVEGFMGKIMGDIMASEPMMDDYADMIEEDLSDMAGDLMDEEMSEMEADASEMAGDVIAETEDMMAEVAETETSVPALPFEISKYDFSASRMVVDGLTLYPLSGMGKDIEGPMGIVAKVSDLMRAYSYEQSAVWDMTIDIDYAAEEVFSMTLGIDMDFAGDTGLNRGDVENSVVLGMAMNMYQKIDPGYGDVIETTSETIIDAQGYKDIRLSSLLGYLADGQLPPTTETDVVSLGTWRIEGQSDKGNGELMSYIGVQEVDFSNFHWLIPASISAEVEDYNLHVEPFVNYMMTSAGMNPADLDEETKSMFDQGMTILQEQGLEKLTMDMSMAMSWDPESGSTGVDMDSDIHGGMQKVIDLDLILPTYAAMLEAQQNEMGFVEPSSLAPIFASSSAFSGLTITADDDGLLEALFATTIAVANSDLMADNPQAGMIANQTPEGLRQMAAGLMRAGATQVATQFPPAVDYINAVAGFIADGGVLTISAQPTEPLGIMQFQTFGDLGPQEMVDTLGLTVTHEADEASE